VLLKFAPAPNVPRSICCPMTGLAVFGCQTGRRLTYVAAIFRGRRQNPTAYDRFTAAITSASYGQ